ncbi:DMT family transporter [Undibacterium sp. TJN19]|uniref:DMT family transporter n=1 Tax=Undibacterium sp. TJN19 TaxID=3413055 RepID=UPI003BF071FC
MHKGVIYALIAAALFGASTPFAKTLATGIAPVMLAGTLYLGSGLGLLIVFVVQNMLVHDKNKSRAGIVRQDIPWLAGAILAGGVMGPVLLMLGLSMTPASSASLLLNMESVLTALLAWFVFRENFDRRIVAGMGLIVIAGALLSWEQIPVLGVPWGALAIIAACLCWALDNNLTRKIAAGDALQIACLKGLVAGAVNLAIALLLHYRLPQPEKLVSIGLIGFCGYGLSLVMFVLALRHLGAARTGAYFSSAPFVGAAMSLLLLGEQPGPLFWLALVLMAVGIWLHLSEHHAHDHQHDPQLHAHAHTHDEHHQHEHDFAWDGKEPHTHQHQHGQLRHTHPHYPDMHHQHPH